jgi:hypothetical protein
MTKYLISFPSFAMDVADDEWDTVSEDSHAVIEDAKAAGCLRIRRRLSTKPSTPSWSRATKR